MINNHYYHHNLALQPFVSFCFLSQVSPVSSILSCLLPAIDFQLFRSSVTSSCHRGLGLPTGLVPIGFQSISFLVGLAKPILWICPSHLILCDSVTFTLTISYMLPKYCYMLVLTQELMNNTNHKEQSINRLREHPHVQPRMSKHIHMT